MAKGPKSARKVSRSNQPALAASAPSLDPSFQRFLDSCHGKEIPVPNFAALMPRSDEPIDLHALLSSFGPPKPSPAEEFKTRACYAAKAILDVSGRCDAVKNKGEQRDWQAVEPLFRDLCHQASELFIASAEAPPIVCDYVGWSARLRLATQALATIAERDGGEALLNGGKLESRLVPLLDEWSDLADPPKSYDDSLDQALDDDIFRTAQAVVDWMGRHAVEVVPERKLGQLSPLLWKVWCRQWNHTPSRLSTSMVQGFATVGEALGWSTPSPAREEDWEIELVAAKIGPPLPHELTHDVLRVSALRHGLEMIAGTKKLPFFPAKLAVPMEKVAPQNAEALKPLLTVINDAKKPRAKLGNENFSLDAAPCCYLAALVKGKGDWVSQSDAQIQHAKKLRERLPLELQDVIEADSRYGARIDLRKVRLT